MGNLSGLIVTKGSFYPNLFLGVSGHRPLELLLSEGQCSPQENRFQRNDRARLAVPLLYGVWANPSELQTGVGRIVTETIER